jgi:hypothetical protein
MAAHRARVTRLIVDARGDAGRSLCILGAGNGNDIELSGLLSQFERVALVDLDSHALQRAIERMPSAARHRVESFGGIDLSGIVPILGSWQRDQTPTDEELSAATEAARVAGAPELGRFDVVASACVLTQLVDSIYVAMPTEHPLRQELVMAVRNRHLGMMIESLNPGGVGVLVTDFVATDTAPEMVHLSDAEFPAAAIEWINQRNFFTGANPYAIRDQLQHSSRSAEAGQEVQVSPAWRWDIGAKQLAVCAITFRRGA